MADSMQTLTGLPTGTRASVSLPVEARSSAPASSLAGSRRLGPGKRVPFGRLIGPALVLLIWSLASSLGVLDPRAVPQPWAVVQTALQRWTAGSLPADILTSVTRAAIGFAIGLTAGTVLALVAGLSRVGEAVVDGTVQVKRAIPSLGLIPLFILWLGIGESFKIAIIAIGVAIPIYINTHAALAGIDQRYVELAEVCRLSRWQFIRHVVMPGALPGFFVGLRLAVVGSWLSLVVLEQINATSGLGYMMYQAQNYGRTDVIVVGLLCYGTFGFLSDAVVRGIQNRVLVWQRTLSH